MRAILSVYDKTGIGDFAKGLSDLGWEIVSSGNTARALSETGLTVRTVEEVTGAPEMLDGRVKTLHPVVHAGILARRSQPSHMSQLAEAAVTPVDLVAVNLYPFLATISKPDVSLDDALENIDIGGPTLLRAAAKNYPDVIVVADPRDYEGILTALRQGGLDQEARRRLATKAFQHVAFYDTVVSGYLRGDDEPFPEELTLAYQRQQTLRYGENPHQPGALYREPLVDYSNIVTSEQQLGQELSLCNVYDLSAALETVREFLDRPAAVVIKHATPSGFAFGRDLAEALEKAIHADATSAFGGIIGLTGPMDMATAQVIDAFKKKESSNIDAIVAPGADPEAVRLLRRTRRRMVLVTVKRLDSLPLNSRNLKHVPGGLLYQQANVRPIDSDGWRVATKAQPTGAEWGYIREAWALLRHIRSNTILVWDGEAGVTLGIGSGQVSRVGSAQLALTQAGERARGALLASDGFFPFSDTVEMAAEHGIRTIIQPGGSIQDEASIEAADKAGIAMVITGERAFWH
jgi:phosphoribosylaminoimidazolecarboxamide formyltransferase/IMP cyclohydrolase